MIVVDIGNTNIVLGVFYKKEITRIIRFNTKDEQIHFKMNTYFNSEKLPKIKLDHNICIIASVSNFSTMEISNFFKSIKFKILKINLNNIPKVIKFNYSNHELGADRIANTFAAINIHGKNSIVVDFGTATTFDITKNNVYIGGLITPGINVSLNALVYKASKLKKIPIVKTRDIIGKNTKKSMQSGFYWGYVSLINGIINKIIFEKKFYPKIILTGGLAKIFKNEIKFQTYYEPNLTLQGLYLIGQKKYVQK